MAQWLTLTPRNWEAAGSNLSGVLAFLLKGAYYEVGYCGKKTFLAGLQCTLTSSCAKKRITDHDFPPPFMWAENNNIQAIATT